MPKATIATPSEDLIVCEIDIAAPPERVFRALTDGSQLMKWWNEDEGCRSKSWQIDPRVGGRWYWKGHDPTGKLVVNGFTEFEMRGEITEFDPPRALTYTWEANFHRIPWKASWVRWELTPGGKGTRVRVTHGGLTDLPIDRKEYGEGWPGVLEMLRRYCE